MIVPANPADRLQFACRGIAGAHGHGRELLPHFGLSAEAKNGKRAALGALAARSIAAAEVKRPRQIRMLARVVALHRGGRQLLPHELDTHRVTQGLVGGLHETRHLHV
jgi:hypothetical protein